jgi:hypothetical protein
MPPDASLPPSRLPPRASADEIARHFPAVWSVRVDPEDLEALPRHGHLSLAGARLPEPPEAVLLDRVLQLVPTGLLEKLDRILIVDSSETGRLGGYDNGIVRVRTPALDLRRGDPEYGSRFSSFTITVLHEIGHAVFEEWLSVRQRASLIDSYIDSLSEEEPPPPGEPSEVGAAHYFIRLFLAALLSHSRPPLGVAGARRRLAELGIVLNEQPRTD